jgi:hypothetical protein
MRKLVVVRVEMQVPEIRIASDMKEQGQGDEKRDLPGNYNMQFPVDQYGDEGETHRDQAKKSTSIVPDMETISRRKEDKGLKEVGEIVIIKLHGKNL